MKVTKKSVKSVAVKVPSNLLSRAIGIAHKGAGAVLGKLPPSITLGKLVRLVWASFKSAGVPARVMCDAASKGKPGASLHPSLACYDLQCHVGAQGGEILITTLGDALKKKLVRPVRVEISRDGMKPRTVLAFTTSKAGENLPPYIVTFDLPAGRIERARLSDGRAASLAYRVREVV